MNELTTTVPVAEIKGIRAMLTPEDIAILIKRSVRYVREELIQTGLIPSVKFGGNSYRVRPEVFEDFIAKGNTGFRHATPSGRFGKQKQGAKS